MTEAEATVKILDKLAGATTEGEYYTNGKYRCNDGKPAWYIEACHIAQDGDKFFFRWRAYGGRGGEITRRIGLYNGFELLEVMAEESPNLRKLLAEPMDDSWGQDNTVGR